MAIELVAAEGVCLPLVVCDQCKARIRNGDGNVLYRFRGDAQLDLDGPHFLHKGCTLTFERSNQSEDEMWLADELDVWLAYLARSAGYDVNDIAGRVKVIDFLAGRE
jgi:hypothetical protein